LYLIYLWNDLWYDDIVFQDGHQYVVLLYVYFHNVLLYFESIGIITICLLTFLILLIMLLFFIIHCILNGYYLFLIVLCINSGLI